MTDVEKFIEKNWNLCIRHNTEDRDTLIGMPYPYTVPAAGHFEEMYYWDTYFTNKGLEISGRYELAKNNTDNMLFLVEKFGFMPNGNRTYYLGKSQPPFLSLMVRDVYKHGRDKKWLENACRVLNIEYEFWMTRRISPEGLNFYDGIVWMNTPENVAKDYERRVGYMPCGTNEEISRHFMATCESGWDISPRWENEAYNIAAVDLNSLMYMFETNMSYFSDELGLCPDLWNGRAEKRKSLMYEYMLAGDGALLDCNLRTGKLVNIYSAASFYPLFVKLAEKRTAEAVFKRLPLLETDYGILTCEKNDFPGTYQWDYPNGWACLQYIAVAALDNYGYSEKAAEIAKKYTALVERVFDLTGNLWEKYNIVNGSTEVAAEYEMPAMMGWTAGAYLFAKKYAENYGKA